MADKSVPDLDMTVGYFMERDGKIVWETYDGQLATWRLALIDLLMSPILQKRGYSVQSAGCAMTPVQRNRTHAGLI